MAEGGKRKNIIPFFTSLEKRLASTLLSHSLHPTEQLKTVLRMYGHMVTDDLTLALVHLKESPD